MSQPDLATLGVLVDPPPVRVVVSGLAPIFRHGLAAALSAAGMACTPVGSPEELTELLSQDASGSDGAATVVVLPAEEASSVAPVVERVAGEDAPTVHVVEHSTAEVYADALRAGATGVVTQDAELSQVVAVVRAAAAGQTLLPRPLAKGLCRQQAGPVPDLQPAERDWLRYLADSGTVASLARNVGYSEREMYRLLGAVYARLGAANRTEALVLAERWGLLEGDGS